MSWPVVKLGGFIETIMGQAPPGEECNKDEVGTPFVKAGEFGVERPIIREWTTKPLRMARKNDVLVCVVGATCGKINKGADCAIGRSVAAIRAVESHLDRTYMYYFLSSWTNRLRAMSQGAAQTVISKDMIENLEIPLPPLTEQKRIAAILDKADAIRRKRQQAIQLAEEFLRSVFLDMFGDPVANPKGWEVKKMHEVIEFKGGHQPPKDTFEYEEVAGYIRLVQIRDFKTDKFKTYIPEHLAKRRFEKDDVMIARYGPPVFQILRGLSGSYNVALMKAIPKGGITKDFIFRLLQLPAYHDTVVANSERTAGQTGVNLDLLNNLDVPLPPLEFQKRIISRVKKAEVALEKMKLKANKLGNLFSSLSQRAFTGHL